MFNRRIIGVFLTLGLAFAPWSHAHAQEVAAPEETTPEIQINEPVEQPEQSIPDLGHEQETPTETAPHYHQSKVRKIMTRTDLKASDLKYLTPRIRN